MNLPFIDSKNTPNFEHGEMESLRHTVETIKNHEIKTIKDGKTKNALQKREELFAVPRYLPHRVLGNQCTTTRTQQTPLHFARS